MREKPNFTFLFPPDTSVTGLQSDDNWYTFRIWILSGDISVWNETFWWVCVAVYTLVVWWWWWLFPRLREFWRMFDSSFPACGFFVVVVFFEAAISSSTLISLFRPGSVRSSSASWDDCGLLFPDDLRGELLSWSVLTLCLDSGIVSPLQLRWVKGVCVFRLTCYLHFRQNDRGH